MMPKFTPMDQPSSSNPPNRTLESAHRDLARGLSSTPPQNPNDETEESLLRSVRLADLIGQDHIKEALHFFIGSAKMRNAPLPHLLLKGRPGLGKTTFAHAIAHELGKTIVALDGPSVTAEKLARVINLELAPDMNLIQSVSGLVVPRKDAILLIDECHAVPREGIEMLYPLMEDFIFQNRRVSQFTLIGATTDPGKLPAPFRDRFGIDFTIDYYNQADLVEVAEQALQKSGEFPDHAGLQDALKALAVRAHGTPRTMLRLLNRSLDVARVQQSAILTVEVVAQTMRMLAIDKFGLDEIDRKILKALATYNRPVGLAAIASAVGEAESTLENVNEPWLVRTGFIERTQRGRVLTTVGTLIVQDIVQGSVQWE